MTSNGQPNSSIPYSIDPKIFFWDIKKIICVKKKKPIERESTMFPARRIMKISPKPSSNNNSGDTLLSEQVIIVAYIYENL